ncbi:MAG: hypothetical protein FJ148_24805 [Deltaproteobacteria bacterium]|nr:hypothetical protein [Deltaproteobacteria bacterium]
MVGDPATPAAVYVDFDVLGMTGWITVGGTSLAAPIVAARAAVTGEVFDATTVYSDRVFRDVVRGNNGFSAGPGSDLVTGRGSLIR